MFELARIFGRIAFLMGKPYEVPDTERVLHIAVVAALVSYILAALPHVGWPSALGHALLDLTLTGLALYAGLQILGKGVRFRRAFAALSGASCYINLASIPISYSSASRRAELAAAQTAGLEPPPPLLAQEIAQFVFLVWGISLLAHVLRFSFDTTIPISVGVAVAYVLVAVSVFGFIFGTH